MKIHANGKSLRITVWIIQAPKQPGTGNYPLFTELECLSLAVSEMVQNFTNLE